MFARRWLIILTAFAVALCSPASSYAAGDASFAQVYTWEQNIDIYIAGDMDSDNLSCKVSNQEAQVAGSGLLADKDVTVRTTILIDISTSVPESVRGDIKIYIDALIRDIQQNEEYKIVTFGRVLHVLQDFTGDRYDLANAAAEIEFTGKQSRIFDAIYNTMPEVQPLEDGSPCYYRTIVITDGIDETPSGITKEELYLKLKADTYPIDVVAVSEGKQEEPEKELSALVRISGGRYANLYMGADISELESALATDDIFWIRGVVPGALLDGSIRQVDISDGRNSLQVDVKFPVFDVPPTPTPEDTKPTKEASIEEFVPTEEALLTQEAVPSGGTAITEPAAAQTGAERPSGGPTAVPGPGGDADSPDEEEDGPFGEYTLVVYIGGGIGIAVLLMIIILVAVAKAKKKKPGNTARNNAYDAFADPQEETAASSNGGSDRTEIVGRGAPSGNNADGGLCIRLCDANNPAQSWDVPLSGFAVIGRSADSQVCLSDSSVSRKQCKLYVADYVPMIENLSEANLTQLNGEVIRMPQRIKAGDKIKCGRVTLLVDSFYAADAKSANSLNKITDFVNL